MIASQLRTGQFKSYPPEARALACRHIQLLRKLPTVFVAVLLREVIGYDWRFPAEREELDRQLSYLSALQTEELRTLFQHFRQIDLTSKVEHVDWVKDPQLFSERLSAYLWSTHQIDSFRIAATEYAEQLNMAKPSQPPRLPRLGIAVIGRGVATGEFPLFRKLRPHGVLFTQVDPQDGLQTLIDAVSARATAHPQPYRHWYIDGGTAMVAAPRVTAISYNGLEPVRQELLHKMQQVIHSGTGGPELMETTLAAMQPDQLGMKNTTRDAMLDRFQVDLLTQGSGTQIYSTIFVQWAAREALRRAQPDTLMARFTPRQRQRPMNELLDANSSGVELDPHGSLVDADMGAYYIWIDQQRLTGAKQSSFLVWFEEHRQALGIGPSVPRGTESANRANLKQLLQWIA